MLAIKLHETPRPSLAKGAWLIPIIDWKSGRVQVRMELRYTRKLYRFITLVDIPNDWPVSFLVRYGDSDYIKQVGCFFENKPLREYENEIKRAIGEWWDARKSGWSDTGIEPGGLMCNEPGLKLEKKLPDQHIKWTKDLRLLYRGNRRRNS
jgi:hypothetical protein